VRYSKWSLCSGTGSRITNTQSVVLVQAAMDRNFLNVLVRAPPATRCGSAFTQSTFMMDKEACEFNTVRSGNAYLQSCTAEMRCQGIK
jgi:hypothetical protein